MAPKSSALRHFATEESLRKFRMEANFIGKRTNQRPTHFEAQPRARIYRHFPAAWRLDGRGVRPRRAPDAGPRRPGRAEGSWPQAVRRAHRDGADPRDL